MNIHMSVTRVQVTEQTSSCTFSELWDNLRVFNFIYYTLVKAFFFIFDNAFFWVGLGERQISIKTIYKCLFDKNSCLSKQFRLNYSWNIYTNIVYLEIKGAVNILLENINQIERKRGQGINKKCLSHFSMPTCTYCLVANPYNLHSAPRPSKCLTIWCIYQILITDITWSSQKRFTPIS